MFHAYQELATILLNYHSGRIVLGSMFVGVSVWLGWSGIRVALLSGACDYSVELPQWSYCSWLDVCWSFGVVGLQWYPCCRLKHATRIPGLCYSVKMTVWYAGYLHTRRSSTE